MDLLRIRERREPQACGRSLQKDIITCVTFYEASQITFIHRFTSAFPSALPRLHLTYEGLWKLHGKC